MRKLGPSDRLVGPARLVIQFGGVPEGLATSIAAALFYEQPSDPIAMQLKSLREQQGIDYILENICRLDKEKDKQLISLIKEKIGMLRERGWVG